MKILRANRSHWSVLIALAAVLAGASATAQTAGPQQGDKKAEASPLRHVNQSLPQWIRLSGEFRNRIEGRTSFGFQPGTEDGYDLTRLRLNLEILPRKWIRGFVQAQDSRAHAIEPSHVSPALKDIVDLRQAYVELGTDEKLRLRGGRQELKFGTERLIGAFDWSNTSRTFDGARFTINGKRIGVDVFALTVVNIYTNRFDKPRPGENFYGVYGSLNDVLPHATLEPYVLWKTLPHVQSETGQPGDADIVTVGLRWVGKLPSGFDYALEAARQEGHFSTDDFSAWAGYGIVGYSPPKFALKPRVSLEYDYASGDRARGDGKVETFDQLYPTNHAYYGIADQVGWPNIRDLRVGVDVKPLAKTKVAFDYHFFRLASGQDGLYNAAGALVVRPPAGGAAHLDVGREADIYLTWTPLRQVAVGGGFGHLFPGRFLKENSAGSGTSFPYAFLTYSF